MRRLYLTHIDIGSVMPIVYLKTWEISNTIFLMVLIYMYVRF